MFKTPLPRDGLHRQTGTACIDKQGLARRKAHRQGKGWAKRSTSGLTKIYHLPEKKILKMSRQIRQIRQRNRNAFPGRPDDQPTPEEHYRENVIRSRGRRFRNCVFTVNNPTIGELGQMLHYAGIPNQQRREAERSVGIDIGEEDPDEEIGEDTNLIYDELHDWDDEKHRYLIFQLERGDNQTPHIQGYAELKQSKKMSLWKEGFFNTNRVHLQQRFGTARQAQAYCSKEDTRVCGPFEKGVISRTQPDKLETVVAMLRADKPLEEIFDANPRQAILIGDKIRSYYLQQLPHREWAPNLPILDRRCVIFYGKSGAGKTQRAHRDANEEFNGSIYVWPWPTGGRQWMPEYNGQRGIILDEFKHQISYTRMMELLGGGRTTCEAKGTQFHLPDGCKLWITTIINPKRWYPNVRNKSELQRRIREFCSICKIHDDPEHPRYGRLTEVDMDEFEFNEPEPDANNQFNFGR